MSAAEKCPSCGGKSFGRAISHDRSCRLRHKARPKSAPPELPTGPLTAPEPIPTRYALRNDAKAAEWLAYVALGGRSCYVPGRGWKQWDGKVWKPSSVEHVRKEIRLSFEALHAKLSREWNADGPLTDEQRAKLYRLLDINRGFTLIRHLRQILTVQS